MFKSQFRFVAAAILLITGTAKVWSVAFGHSQILTMADPLLRLKFDHLMLLAGVLELVVAGVCLCSKSSTLAPLFIAWLATCLLTYRIALWWIDWRHPCPCLGNLTDALHIPPKAAYIAMKIILAYLLIGSYASLFCLWKQSRAVRITAPTSVGTFERHD